MSFTAENHMADMRGMLKFAFGRNTWPYVDLEVIQTHSVDIAGPHFVLLRRGQKLAEWNYSKLARVASMDRAEFAQLVKDAVNAFDWGEPEFERSPDSDSYRVPGETVLRMKATEQELGGLAFDFGRFQAETEAQLVAMDAALTGDARALAEENRRLRARLELGQRGLGDLVVHGPAGRVTLHASERVAEGTIEIEWEGYPSRSVWPFDGLATTGKVEDILVRYSAETAYRPVRAWVRPRDWATLNADAAAMRSYDRSHVVTGERAASSPLWGAFAGLNSVVRGDAD